MSPPSDPHGSAVHAPASTGSRETAPPPPHPTARQAESAHTETETALMTAKNPEFSMDTSFSGVPFKIGAKISMGG
jgi:hypothetical protein